MAINTRLAAIFAALILSFYLYFLWTPRRASGTPTRMSTEPGKPAAESAESAEDDAESSLYEPSITDVLIVKSILNKGLNLPMEIVDALIDFAEYWAHSSTEVSFAESRVIARGGYPDENSFLVSRYFPRNLLSPSRQ
jgi:hypothetical protein